MTFDLFAAQEPDASTSELIQLPGAELLFMPALFTQTEADQLQDELNRTIAWQQETIQLYGQTHNLPRLTAWYGDAEAELGNAPVIGPLSIALP